MQKKYLFNSLIKSITVSTQNTRDPFYSSCCDINNWVKTCITNYNNSAFIPFDLDTFKVLLRLHYLKASATLNGTTGIVNANHNNFMLLNIKWLLWKESMKVKKIYTDERRFTEWGHHRGHHLRSKIIVSFQSKETRFGRLSSLLVNRWRWRLSSIVLQNKKKPG